MHQPRPTRSLPSFFLLLTFALHLLAACTSPVPTNSPVLATETALPSETAAPLETAVPSETATALPTLKPDLERPQYILDLQMNYTSKAAVVNETIAYPNWTGETLTMTPQALDEFLTSNPVNGGWSIAVW